MKIHQLAILTAAAAALPLNSASAATTWNAGHGDLGIGYDAGELDPHVHLHAGATVDNVVLLADEEYAPGDVLPSIAFNKSQSRPAGSQWAFFGVSTGQPVWTFPQSEDPTLPFIGFGAEELSLSDWSTSFTITLTGLAGSGVSNGGYFSVFQTDSFGSPTLNMVTSDGITSADFLTLAAGGHAHYNIAFTQPGIYEATFNITGTHATDGVKSADATYKFEVIPEPSSAMLGGLAALSLLRRRRN